MYLLPSYTWHITSLRAQHIWVRQDTQQGFLRTQAPTSTGHSVSSTTALVIKNWFKFKFAFVIAFPDLSLLFVHLLKLHGLELSWKPVHFNNYCQVTKHKTALCPLNLTLWKWLKLNLLKQKSVLAQCLGIEKVGWGGFRFGRMWNYGYWPGESFKGSEPG